MRRSPGTPCSARTQQGTGTPPRSSSACQSDAGGPRGRVGGGFFFTQSCGAGLRRNTRVSQVKKTEASGAFNDQLEVTWEAGRGTGQNTRLLDIK